MDFLLYFYAMAFAGTGLVITSDQQSGMMAMKEASMGLYYTHLSAAGYISIALGIDYCVTIIHTLPEIITLFQTTTVDPSIKIIPYGKLYEYLRQPELIKFIEQYPILKLNLPQEPILATINAPVTATVVEPVIATVTESVIAPVTASVVEPYEVNLYESLPCKYTEAALQEKARRLSNSLIASAPPVYTNPGIYKFGHNYIINRMEFVFDPIYINEFLVSIENNTSFSMSVADCALGDENYPMHEKYIGEFVKYINSYTVNIDEFLNELVNAIMSLGYSEDGSKTLALNYVEEIKRRAK